LDLKSKCAWISAAHFLAAHQSANATTPEELAAQAGRFLDDFLPELMRCVPDWVEVESGEYPHDNPLKKQRAGADRPGSA